MRKLIILALVCASTAVSQGPPWVKPSPRPGLKVEKAIAADTNYTGVLKAFEPSLVDVQRTGTAFTVNQRGAGNVVAFQLNGSDVFAVTDDGKVYVVGSLVFNNFEITPNETLATTAYVRENGGGGGGAGVDEEARTRITALETSALHARVTNTGVVVFDDDSLVNAILSSLFTLNPITRRLDIDTTKIATWSTYPNQTWSGYPALSPVMGRVHQVYINQTNGLRLTTGGTGVVQLDLPVTADLVVNTLHATNVPSREVESFGWLGYHSFDGGIAVGRSSVSGSAKIHFTPKTTIDDNQYADLMVDDLLYEQGDTLYVPHLGLGTTHDYVVVRSDTGNFLMTKYEGSLKQGLNANLTTFSSPGAWKFFYSNGSGVIVPISIGSSGKVLKSNGASAAPTWENDATGTGSPAGSVTELQYNDGGIFGSSKNLTFQDGPPTLTIGDPTGGGTAGMLGLVGGDGFTTTLAASGSGVTSYTFTFPPDDGTNHYRLVTNGSGVTTWEAPLAGITGFTWTQASQWLDVTRLSSGYFIGQTNQVAVLVLNDDLDSLTHYIYMTPGGRAGGTESPTIGVEGPGDTVNLDLKGKGIGAVRVSEDGGTTFSKVVAERSLAEHLIYAAKISYENGGTPVVTVLSESDPRAYTSTWTESSAGIIDVDFGSNLGGGTDNIHPIVQEMAGGDAWQTTAEVRSLSSIRFSMLDASGGSIGTAILYVQIWVLE